MDPIAAQFLPSAAEAIVAPEERADPIGDNRFSPVSGIVHRYPDRVLLKVTGVCLAYCRFCFRRDMIGPAEGILSPSALDQALAYIADHSEIWEVILTGGDPLTLSDRRLGEILDRLRAIPHVKIIRFHTRAPIVEPSRVTPALVDLLRAAGPVYVVLHCNHPREITASASAACALLADAGLPLLSGTVLLRGVNDKLEILSALMRTLVENRIKPYYLYHPDLARGTSHFRLSLEEGQALVHALHKNLSGLCQPTYVLDIPDGHGKVPVGRSYATREATGWLIEDPHGETHRYGTAE